MKKAKTFKEKELFHAREDHDLNNNLNAMFVKQFIFTGIQKIALGYSTRVTA